jgi:putative endonuclease
MSLKIGIEAEEKASSYLVKEGYRLLARNFHSKFGEIDIIALKDNVLHFYEVKFSKNIKIIKTVDYYLMTHPSTYDYQIDAILVTPENIEIIKNISY